MLINKTVIEFLDETASNNPVPGGGSIAAHSGATAAALVEMVANLTIHKKNYELVWEEMKEISCVAKQHREAFLLDIDRDAVAFDQVMRAYQLPKSTDEEIDIRRKHIQTALKQAANIPLEVAKRALEVIQLSQKVSERGNKNAITDSAVSAMMARTSALSALYNVKINLKSITNKAFVESTNHTINKIESGIIAIEQNVLKGLNI